MRRKVRENHPRVAPISGHLAGGDGKTGVNESNRSGFSINGGHRNLRGIGQVRMVGSGGWSGGGRGVGRFASGNSSWYFSANDPSVVKRSSRGNAAMLDMKYRWIKGGNQGFCPNCLSLHPYLTGATTLSPPSLIRAAKASSSVATGTILTAAPTAAWAAAMSSGP